MERQDSIPLCVHLQFHRGETHPASQSSRARILNKASPWTGSPGCRRGKPADPAAHRESTPTIHDGSLTPARGQTPEPQGRGESFRVKCDGATADIRARRATPSQNSRYAGVRSGRVGISLGRAGRSGLAPRTQAFHSRIVFNSRPWANSRAKGKCVRICVVPPANRAIHSRILDTPAYDRGTPGCRWDGPADPSARREPKRATHDRSAD